MALDLASLATEGRRGDESASSVNRWLRDHLFLDKGYQLSVDVDRVAHGAHLGDTPPLSGFGPGNSATHLARLVLVDSNGRRYSFHEVGSGIGYLLPVLAGAAQGGVQCIEQPELHLHPAMQAALGDVLIEAANSGAQLLVETHSEHLILRLLRRIRQTHAGKPLGEELRVRPESVSVVYFLPGGDGTTRVRQLRVTDEGDFMDRWPNGFFEERGGELWDE